jgi:hypothetical protein
MAAPVVTSITFDKAGYVRGDTITVTVTYTPGTSDLVQSFTAQADDPVTGQRGTLSATFTVPGAVPNPCRVSGSDDGGRTWTPRSDTGGVAVLTATA